MHGVSRGAVRSLLALWLVVPAALPAAAQVAGGQLTQFRQEAEAFNRQDPFANAYRAGHYNGYLAGVLDTLQGRSVCFRECICELDKIVERHLADHPETIDRPVIEWLVPLMEARFPCK
jgi:hypothetical protein